MSLKENLDSIINKSKSIEEKLANSENLPTEEYIKLTKEYSELSEIVEQIKNYNKASEEFSNLEEIINDENQDAEIKEMAEEEYYSLKKLIPELENSIKLSLLPKDKEDEKNAILEIRAGAGGDEAGLFGYSLFRMYQRYAENNGWKFEILSVSDTGIGGLKEGSASISGVNVFARLKYESGVHRVQRVPETETNGRIHTSTVTVAVLPEAEEFDIDLQEKDLRIDVFRSSGAGGQHVNTTDSAVRIVHLPTGVMVSVQDEKSQHKNKAKALKILRARLYEAEREARDAERAAARKGQVGTGDRSERIRTYNYPQGRVTDHRINLTLYKINAIVNEGELDDLINSLITEEQAQRLASIESNL